MTDALLLPSSSTGLERDLSTSMDALPRLGAAAELIRDAKRENIPDSVVPFLLYEYGLGELLPYLSDPRTAISTGVLWQRLRGTPKSFSIALGWIGNDGTIEESEGNTINWSQFQLGLDSAPVDLSQTDSVVEIGRLSSPVRSSLFRIYGGWYDGRRFQLDNHKLSSLDTLCDHTGVYLKSEWPQLSFGREFKDEQGDISGDLAAALGIHRFSGISGRYEDRTILSNSILGETSWRTLHIEDLSSVISRLHFSVSGPWWNNATDWQVAYDWTQVFDWAGLQNKFTPALKFARAGMYLSDYAELGDTNACFPARSLDEFGDGAVLLSEADPATGEHILSEHLSRVEFTEINERIEHGTQLGSMWIGSANNQLQIQRFPLEHGSALASTGHPNPPAHATLTSYLSNYNGTFNNRHDTSETIFGDGAGHLLGVSSAEIVPSHREHTRELAYDDSFELSRSRLSEFTPLVNEQAISRGHTSAAISPQPSSAWDDTALNWNQTLTWQNFSQPEQILGFSRTMVTLSENGHLSDSDGILGDTHATLGFFEDERVERSHGTTSTTAHSPSGFWYHLRERFATLAYDDSFELSRTRLDEFIPLVNQQAITREHGSAATWLTEQFNSWNDTSPSWAAASDWQASGWFDAANEPTWFEAYSWQVFPQLEHVLSFHQSHQYLSDTTDGLSETDAVLGFEFSQRFERDHFAQATEDRQSIAERQHVRTYYPATVALYIEPTWADGDWAGENATDWHESADDWQAGSWASLDWMDSSTITWANQLMWGRIARWQVASLVVESVHETHA